MKKVSVILMVFWAPLFVFAHPAHGDGGGFLEGFTHPVMGVDHLLAMLCAGMLTAVAPGRLRWMCPVAFTLGLALGAAAGFGLGLGDPFEPGIVLSVTVFGVLLALARSRPVWLVPALLGLFALFHGHAHAVEMPEGANAAGFMAGFALGSVAMQAAGLLCALILRELPRPSLSFRLAGGALALSGVWLFFS